VTEVEVDDQRLLVTLVHGTWGRYRLRKNAPFWFEHESPFCKRLGAEFTSRNISYRLNPFFWSGANSVFARDEAARALAQHLITEHCAKPYATQIIVAHSHAGNIALRALHYLKIGQIDPAARTTNPNPLVVTMATPFIELHRIFLGFRAGILRMSIRLAAALVLMIIGYPLYELIGIWYFGLIALLMVSSMSWGEEARDRKISRLADATRLDTSSVNRLLTIRAVDDEASLVMALGTIINRASVSAMNFGFGLFLATLLSMGAGGMFVLAAAVLGYYELDPFFGFGRDLISLFVTLALLTPLATFTLLLLLMLARCVHGRELATASIECQLNTQSAPDGKSISMIVTLPWSWRKGRSLRHAIYEHPGCVKAIADWTQAQLVRTNGPTFTAIK
jgi:hypothetical protein